jgi:thymidine kinase
VIAALAGERSLIVVEGAAGAGKTTTLSATRDLLAAHGRRLAVVTPTLKAAKVAQSEVGAHAGSAGWLAFQHGWRWDTHGTWTRLALGDPDPVTGRNYVGPVERATVRAGDLLIVDEAGMLDQDTARALFTIADEHQVRVALLGDRHQLSAVGRGGVLDLAARWADPDASLTLDVVHRFTRDIADADGSTRTVPDVEYADLTVAMRTGDSPGEVFDVLLARNQIQLHTTAADLQATLAETAAGPYVNGDHVAVVVDTREQAGHLNAAIRDRLVATGRADDRHATSTGAGQRIGVGDRVATRRNDRDLDVANRDTWTVTGVDRHGRLTVTSRDAGQRVLPADYVQRHVELVYATTAHGVQGDTVIAAHLVVGEHTGAASAYVGMTRGRTSNIAHLVAADVTQAREQWVEVFTRDRADLGPGHAAEQARREAVNYAQPRPLEQVLAELHDAWNREARCLERLERDDPRRDDLRAIVVLRRTQPAELATVEDHYQQAHTRHAQATHHLDRSDALITRDTTRLRDHLLSAWQGDRHAARVAAHVVDHGPGRLGLRLAAVNRAREELARWSIKWQPYLPDMPTRNDHVVRKADHADNHPRIWQAFEAYAHQHAEAAHPEHAVIVATAQAADTELGHALHALYDTKRRHAAQLNRYGSLGHTDDPDAHLERLERAVTTGRTELATVQQQIGRLSADPAIRALPAGQLTREHDLWRSGYDADRESDHQEARLRAMRADHARTHRPRHTADHIAEHLGPDRDPGPGIGR